MRIVTPGEMQALEARFMEETGVSSATLMGRAAEGMLEAAVDLMGRRDWPPRDSAIPPELPRLTGLFSVVVCGPGANGGDGWALAWRLYDMNSDVLVLTVGTPRPGTAAHENYRECTATWRTVRVLDLAGAGLDECEDGEMLLEHVIGLCGQAMLRAQLCVDALFGTGLNRPLSGLYLGLGRMMGLLAERGARVLAADIPSGLNGDTGLDGGACPANVTVTFQFIKRGQLLGAGQDLCGRLICHDIGIPETFAPAHAPVYVRPEDVHIARRRHDSHKGTYGHLMLIAGSEAYAGAALLSTRAALRSGAGLVTTACVAGLRPLLQLSAPAAMALVTTPAPAFDEASAARIAEALPGKTALAVGPGLTRQAAPAVVRQALMSGLHAVLDADALNLIAASPELRALVGPRHVLTPHPGEMARLLGRPCADPAADARALARELGCVVLLKGCATCVSSGTHTFMMTPGTPGMACGGSGDVLTGVIGALLAQGLTPVRAAVYGAMLHGRAGTLAQQRLGEVSMNAADLLDELPVAFMEATGERER